MKKSLYSPFIRVENVHKLNVYLHIRPHFRTRYGLCQGKFDRNKTSVQDLVNDPLRYIMINLYLKCLIYINL